MDKDIIKELEEIYKACNDERVWEIQNRLGNLLKGLCEKSTNPHITDSKNKEMINMLSEEENNVINNVIRDLTSFKECIDDNGLIDHINETINLINNYRDEKEE